MNSNSLLGTEYKFNVHLESIDGLHMSDYDFECAFYVYRNKQVVIPKSHMKKIDDDNYIAVIEREDAMRIGRGQIKCDVTALIPDTDFSDGFRTEKITLWSEENIT